MSLQQQESHEYEDIENYNATPTTTPPAAGSVVPTQQSKTHEDINLTCCPAYVPTVQRSGEIEEVDDTEDITES